MEQTPVSIAEQIQFQIDLLRLTCTLRASAENVVDSLEQLSKTATKQAVAAGR